MTTPPRWLWPRSLAGQMALLIGLALFVAQAINLALLIRERREFAVQQVAGQAANRVSDAIERAARGQPPVPDRGRVRLLPADPVRPGTEDDARVEAAIRQTLGDQGIAVDAVSTGIGPLPARSGLLRRMPADRARFLRRHAAEMVIAIHRPGLGWLVQRTPWVRRDPSLVWRLAGQTLVLFVIILLPVLWAARRISRPLRDLTRAAERFGRGEATPVAVRGPHDVAVLIDAHNRLTERVLASLDEKDRMLGAIGHDLRTPLAALRVRVESVEDDTDRARMVDTIDEMNRTLDDILSLARVGRPSEAPTEVDMAALVDAVVEDFRDLGHAVDYAEAGRLTMRLRPALMRRAVRNLLENAIKYGGGEVAVSIAAEPRSVAVAVADRGPGIPQERMQEVFDPFTRLESSRNRDTGGIGLGLALTRTIVRDAGGDVTLANRPDGGLIATITLPR